jgi:radical SAM superfamily enzyme YgiQ (UPF0313 family)
MNMAKILLIQPNKWGRGITSIWIPSHAAALKNAEHDVTLFDSTFYQQWTENEIEYNTENKQYLSTDYSKHIKFNQNDIFEDLQKTINSFNPNIIFWAGLSSHIHGEGEYVNIQYGHELLKKIKTDAIKIAGGLQPTAAPEIMFEKFGTVDYFLRGESEMLLVELANKISDMKNFENTDGLIKKINGKTIVNKPQQIISDMDIIPSYDYSVFEDQVFYRAYNGKVIKAVDYEMSRGCVYVCSYCVETSIQQYYGFTETTNTGVLKNASSYLRNKSAKRVFEEIKNLYEKFGVTLIRCQDTNFLTIDSKMLNSLATLIDESKLPILLYIETRPEGINNSSIKLLKKLKVDGVGMGVEISSEEFRKTDLNRYPSQEKIIDAFRLLRNAGIKRTAYNIIGLPNETEEMLIDTIKFNQILEPDNITVAFYSPYLGTDSARKSKKMGDFNNYEFDVDNQLRTVTKSEGLGKEILEFYKNNFSKLVKEGINNLDELKKSYGLK